jgi:hypothetical protein
MIAACHYIGMLRPPSDASGIALIELISIGGYHQWIFWVRFPGK